MTLDLLMKIIGWFLVAGPTLVFVSISFSMIWGAAKDDGLIHMLVTLGLSIFGMGVGILIVSYGTDLLK